MYVLILSLSQVVRDLRLHPQGSKVWNSLRLSNWHIDINMFPSESSHEWNIMKIYYEH